MDNKQILEKAIQKAIDGGWSMHGTHHLWLAADCSKIGFEIDPQADEHYRYEMYDTPAIIFDHDFAKALWGDGYTCAISWSHDEMASCPIIEFYKKHLQQMVTADDPIKYLGDNI